MKTNIVWPLLGLVVCTPVAGKEQHADETRVLEEIVVTASPLEREALEMTQAATVLSGEELKKQLAPTIGETVNRIPGVQSAYFGPGVGRPIIRGLGGARVDVLENNLSTNDVSNVSADHAVSVEPFLAEQVEVIRGPSTLIYGSDTIGGVVNVRTNRIPSYLIDGLVGEIQLQGDTVADERFGGIELNGGFGNWAFHFDAFERDTGNYEIPGFAELRAEEEQGHEGEEEDHAEEEEVFGILENSAVKTRGGAIGGSYIGEHWHAGISLSTYDTLYGIPGHAHPHEEEDEEGHEQDELLEEEQAHVSVDLRQERVDTEFVLDAPFGGFERLKLLLASNNYQHLELEGDEIGTRFDNDTIDGRLELTHLPIAGGWRGVVGIQFLDRDFVALGEEAFVPASKTEQLGLFLLEEREFDDWRLEFGARLEKQEIDTATGLSASHEPLSVAAGALWHFSPLAHLSFNISRAERAPAEEELFAEGPHIATQTFEIGNPDLDEEGVTSLEVSLRRHEGRFTGALTFFHNAFSDFIYLADAGIEEDGFPVRTWTQADADFTGFEAEGRYALGELASGEWAVHGFYDTVDAELEDGSNLPRIAPSRLGAGLDWKRAGWRASLFAVRYDEQDDVTSFETPTDGYTLLNADLGYTLSGPGGTTWDLFMKARNLGDEEARNHTSFLKDQAPLPGRNVMFGFRTSF